jgi:hypothetical protein
MDKDVVFATVIVGFMIFGLILVAVFKPEDKRIRVSTGGWNPQIEYLSPEEYNRLKAKDIVVGNTLRR